MKCSSHEVNSRDIFSFKRFKCVFDNRLIKDVITGYNEVKKLRGMGGFTVKTKQGEPFHSLMRKSSKFVKRLRPHIAKIDTAWEEY
jgi:hypothetical protein